MSASSFGEALAEALGDAKLSHKQFARRWGCRESSLTHWLNDTLPKGRALNRILQEPEFKPETKRRLLSAWLGGHQVDASVVHSWIAGAAPSVNGTTLFPSRRSLDEVYPLTTRLFDATVVRICGTSLRAVVNDYAAFFNGGVNPSCSIQAMVLDPRDATVMATVQTLGMGVVLETQSTRESLRSLCEHNRSRQTKGLVEIEIRVSRFNPQVAMVISDAVEGLTVELQLRNHDTQARPYPMLWVSRVDPSYEKFTKLYDDLWDDAEVWNC